MNKQSKHPEIIFFDVDGTLIDMDTKQITEPTRQMLKDLQNEGIRIAVCTGRSPMMVPTIEGIDFDVFLTYNGSLCYDRNGTIIRSHPLANEDVERILENAKKLNRPVILATDHEQLVSGVDQDLADYAMIANVVLHPDEDFEQRRIGVPVYQMMAGADLIEREELVRDVPGAKLAAWWDRAVDIVPSQGGKGAGVRAVLEFYGLTRDQSAAFGDGSNDLEMLEAVGCGVAMENATEDVKAIADEICPSVKKDGVLAYCRSKGWID